MIKYTENLQLFLFMREIKVQVSRLHCHGTKVVKNGKNPKWVQNFKCKYCKK